MDPTHIVQASDLDGYSSNRMSQGVIPELIYLLVKQSEPPPTVCRIPYGDAVNQPGWDGLVEIDQSFLEYVPAGVSYWEIGTDAKPRDKATTEFKKRTDAMPDEERAKSTFVFVTPRSSASGGWNQPEQAKWLKSREDSGWKDIRIIDGVKLADWLCEFPAIGYRMAKEIGLTGTLGGLNTPTEHWNLIRSQGGKGDPPLPPELFTTSRDAACNALEAVFAGESQRLLLFSESERDVDDFVAAYLQILEQTKSQEYASRCLFIDDDDAWRTISELRQSHILIANPRLGLDSERQNLQTIAIRKGHGVVIPLCGALSGNNPEIIRLRSPSESQTVAVLKDAGFSEVRARELGGSGSISALLRDLLGLGSVPPYATWGTARQLAQAGLAGQWNANALADTQAMEKLLGKEYGEWIETLRNDALRSDSPLVQTDEKWRFVVRGEAWSALGNRITDADLDRLEDIAVQVLGERDPQFDLPKEERHAASIHGKTLEHSNHLRKGLAETLALLGCRPRELSSCTLEKPETTALMVVRKLLSGATWDRWASLDSHLPLLAEAAPSEFLDAVEFALKNLDDTPFHEVFAQEGGGVLGGWNYMSGLLWALETLAWDPDHLSRVSVILSDLASFDPGGHYANRPANSLTDIFLPWHVQTTAPFEKREIAIKTVICEHPDVGWKLLLALLPHNYGSTSGCRRPAWRDYIPDDWKEETLQTEYWDQITIFTNLAVELAKESTDKLCELIGHLPDLPQPAHESLLKHLGATEIVKLPEAERFPLWEKLEDLVRKHRKFSDKAWAFPEEAVAKIEEAAKVLAPEAPELKYRHLFRDRYFGLFEEKGNHDAQLQRLNGLRQAAVKKILDAGTLADVLRFADEVAAPYEVGGALGRIASDEIENEILPSLLNEAADSPTGRLAAGFVWTRYWDKQWDWVDDVLERNLTPGERACFLVLLPFEDDVWQRVSAHLGEKNEGLYWQNPQIRSYASDGNLTVAIEKLLQFDRPDNALLCIALTMHKESGFSETLATRALLAVLENPESIERLDNYQTVEVIKRLQKSDSADQEALFKIEWNFLPWLDQFSSGSPVTLENWLASDPAFFAEVVSLVFRSTNKNEDNDNTEEPDVQKQHFIRNAYKLLNEWKRCPGIQDDETLDVGVFNEWVSEARRVTEETGHAEVAQSQIGHVLTHAPADPDGLWIHKSVAQVLNLRDTDEMRSGFTTELFNQRGAYYSTDGQEERELARENKEKAEVLDSKGYTRFATVMREFAEQYERQAEREERQDSMED